MKETIRLGTFETNSSSCHTVTVQGKRNVNPRITSSDGIIEVTLGEYGWDGPSLYSFGEKLAYAMSMILHTEYPNFNHYDENSVIDDSILENLDGYKTILTAINSYVKCDAVIIRRLDSWYPYGYIDHQSFEHYKSLQDFLDDWNVDIERFLFDYGVVVHIDNDNR